MSNLNMNLINNHSLAKVIGRGETKKDIIIPNRKNKGKIVISKGTKGWIEWNGKELTLELDNSIKYPNWIGSIYRLCYKKGKFKNKLAEALNRIQNRKTFTKDIKAIKSTENEKIDYLIKKIRIHRTLTIGLEKTNINYNLLKICLKKCADKKWDLENFLKAACNLKHTEFMKRILKETTSRNCFFSKL